jgi:hypothetical protein
MAGYLQMENDAVEKHVYYKGEIFAMSGAGARHTTIPISITRREFAPTGY